MFALCAARVSCSRMGAASLLICSRAPVVRGQLQERDVADLRPGDDDLHLHDAVLRLHRLPGDGATRRRGADAAIPAWAAPRCPAWSTSGSTVTSRGQCRGGQLARGADRVAVRLEAQQRHQAEHGAGDREQYAFHRWPVLEDERFDVDVAARHPQLPQRALGGGHHAARARRGRRRARRCPGRGGPAAARRGDRSRRAGAGRPGSARRHRAAPRSSRARGAARCPRPGRCDRPR